MIEIKILGGESDIAGIISARQDLGVDAPLTNIALIRLVARSLEKLANHPDAVQPLVLSGTTSVDLTICIHPTGITAR